MDEAEQAARRARLPGRETEQLTTVLGAVATALGASVVGVWLHGSAVSGGLRPASDLDLLVVVDRPTTRDERRLLVEQVLTVSGRRAPRPGRPVELTVVRAGALRPWRYPPQREFQYGEWLRAGYESGAVPGPEADPDLALLVTVCRAHGRTLVGRPPADLLDRPPWDDVVDAMLTGVPELLDDVEDDAVNGLLTLARIRHTLSTGEIVPKDAAAAWAIPLLRGEHRTVLAQARALYLGEDGTAPVIEADSARRCAGELIRSLRIG